MPGKKKRKKLKEINTLLIASYRERYSKKALNEIKRIIYNERPKKIIILKIIEEEPTLELVEANVGIEERKDFLESVREEKKQMADEYASDLIKITDKLEIHTEVHLRKGRDVSDEIIEEFKKMNVDHVVLHGPKKGPLGKILEGSISEEVKEGLGPRKVTLLE